jgi:quercetin dioxygenase-like cupin family protein
MQPEERLTICASISSALEDCRAGTPAHKRSRNKQPRYVESGEITVEMKSGEKKHVIQGQVLAQTVGSIHRGFTGDSPVVLIVFYAGEYGLSLLQKG